MEQEITKNLRCILLRNGIEIWEEKDKTNKLQDLLSNIKVSTFVHFEDMSINTADIVGIFDPKTMDNYSRRKNGEWKCREGVWHEKGQRSCDCLQDISERRML